MAKSKEKIEFHWNYPRSVIIERKGFGKAYNKEVAEVFKRHMDKYVPWDSTNTTGFHLATMVYATSTKDHGTVVYNMKYANAQYRGEGYKHDTSYHKRATSYWDKVCWTNEKKQILSEIDKIRKRRSK